MTEMDFVGLDLGSHTIKAVQLKKEKDAEHCLVDFGFAPAPALALSSDSEIDFAAYSKALGQFFQDNKFTTRNVVAALPESQIFTRVIEMPLLSEKELDNAMKWEAEQYIPVPLKEVSLDYQVLERFEESGRKKVMQVLLVAAPLTLVKKYLKILEEAKLNSLGLETETIAAARSLVGTDPKGPTSLVTNIGAATTDISIVSRGKIRFTRSISTGGEAFARAVAEDLGFEMERAEEYKRNYGLEEELLEGKVMRSIKPIFDVVVSEITRSISYYASYQPRDKIERVILGGGTASLPGILVYLAAALNIEVQLGDPWKMVAVSKDQNRKQMEDIGPSFAVAVGLALKEL